MAWVNCASAGPGKRPTAGPSRHWAAPSHVLLWRSGGRWRRRRSGSTSCGSVDGTVWLVGRMGVGADVGSPQTLVKPTCSHEVWWRRHRYRCKRYLRCSHVMQSIMRSLPAWAKLGAVWGVVFALQPLLDHRYDWSGALFATLIVGIPTVSAEATRAVLRRRAHERDVTSNKRERRPVGRPRR
jgi:hypothetical protein